MKNKKSRNDAASQIPYGPNQKPWSEQVPKGAVVTGPLEDPCKIYPKIPPPNLTETFPPLEYTKFELSPEGLSQRERMEAMAKLETFAKTQHINFTGFQVNEDLDFNQFSWLLDIHTNNVGDPYSDGYMTLNTKLIERSVMDYFAAIWNAEWPHHDTQGPDDQYADRHWGYVLSMGSTEGNLYGTYNARNYLDGGMLLHDRDETNQTYIALKKGKKVPVSKTVLARPLDLKENPNKYTPVAFFSEDAHYSVIKAMNVMQVKTFYEVGIETKEPCPINNGIWPKEVPSHDIIEHDITSGTIRVDDLEKLLVFFLDRDYPPLIVLNVGSTWKGAYDNVAEVNQMLLRLGKKYDWLWQREVEYKTESGKIFKDLRRGFWLHIDGALGAPYLPFLEMAYNQGIIEHKAPDFDFRNEAVMSICCSMHKWIGGPWPGGVYMTKSKYQLNPPATAGYIGSADTTLGGSRNAFSPVLLWSYFAQKSYQENMEKALSTLETAKYLQRKLKDLEQKLQQTDPEVDLWIHRSRLSLAVCFRMVNPTIAYKYTVDAERLCVPVSKTEVEERTFAHIYAMQSLSSFGIVDAFIQELTEVCEKSGWKAAFPTDADKTYDHEPNPGKRKPIVSYEK